LSSAYTASGPFLLLTLPSQQVGWAGTRSWEGTQLGQLIPTEKRDIPYHMTSCSEKNPGGWRLAGAAIAQGLAGHQSVGREQLCHLFFLGFTFLFLFWLLFFLHFFKISF